jgi:hypothetical protein
VAISDNAATPEPVYALAVIDLDTNQVLRTITSEPHLTQPSDVAVLTDAEAGVKRIYVATRGHHVIPVPLP